MTAKLLAAATFVAAAVSAGAQYVQPYNPSDPQNYGSPAAQQYQGQQNAYGNQNQQPRYDPNSYDGNGVQQPLYNGQQQGYGNGQQQGYGDQGGYNGQQTIQQAPPPLPDYEQPEAPGDGYLWTPGYWAYGNGGYFWQPGAWVLAPTPARFGPLVTGATAAADTSGTSATGVPASAITAAWTTGLAISAPVFTAATGTAETSSITASTRAAASASATASPGAAEAAFIRVAAASPR